MSQKSFPKLVALLAQLRAPGGCPWDREQTPRSLRTYLLEEAYEVLDAIEREDPQALQDELGDLLLQILFHAQIAAEAGRFTIDDVLRGLEEKLVRRHPHVFGSTSADSAAEVRRNWEARKAVERSPQEPPGRERNSRLDSIARSLPALLEAYQLTRRASQVGFDWRRRQDVLAKLAEEAAELEAEAAGGSRERVEAEMGDLLFVAVNLARFLEVDPELALRRANRKFRDRFLQIEQELARQGRRLEEARLDEMDAIWERSKRSE